MIGRFKDKEHIFTVLSVTIRRHNLLHGNAQENFAHFTKHKQIRFKCQGRWFTTASKRIRFNITKRAYKFKASSDNYLLFDFRSEWS